MRDHIKDEVLQAQDRYIKDLISWASGFPDQDKTAIEQAIYIYAKMIISSGINKKEYLFRRLEIIKAPVNEGFGMCQPLIDGRGGISAYRIYISNDYNFNMKQMQAVFLHEMVHTMSKVDILKHKSRLYHACFLWLFRYYDINILNIGEVEKID